MKNSITKNKWFWIVVVLVGLSILGKFLGLYDEKDVSSTDPVIQSEQSSPNNGSSARYKSNSQADNSIPEVSKPVVKEPPYIITGSVPTYTIIDEGEVNYSTVIRPVCNIVAESGLSQSDIEKIAKDIVNRYIKLKKVNAVGIFIFSDKSKIGKEAYDIAKIDWAPYGDWGKAGDIESGDYSKHRFNIALSQQ